MNKLLVICGPTATGKTSLGVHLAKKYNGEIVSADSRQVYRGLDILTGKDIGKNSKFEYQNSRLNIGNTRLSVGFREKEGIPVWLVDVVDPAYTFNVGEYVKLARPVIEDIWRRDKLPVIVGGSGLYINALTKPLSDIIIPPDKKLRKTLDKLSVEELIAYLVKTNRSKYEKMNSSDRLNPRRLIRAIEISVHEKEKKSEAPNFYDRIRSDSLFIGLTADWKELYGLVDRRAKERAETGAVEETYKLFESGLPVELPALTSTGFRQLLKYIEKSISLDEAIRLWTLVEHAYVREQLRWFKRDGRIKWFNIADKDYIDQIEKRVERWYTGKNSNYKLRKKN